MSGEADFDGFVGVGQEPCEGLKGPRGHDGDGVRVDRGVHGVFGDAEPEAVGGGHDEGIGGELEVNAGQNRPGLVLGGGEYGPVDGLAEGFGFEEGRGVGLYCRGGGEVFGSGAVDVGLRLAAGEVGDVGAGLDFQGDRFGWEGCNEFGYEPGGNGGLTGCFDGCLERC